MREKHVSLRVRNRTAYNYSIPVQNCRKFSAVRGHTSRNNSIFSRPAAVPPIEISKKTTGFPRLTASATLVSISPIYLIYTRSLPTSHGNMHSHSFPSPRPGYTHTPIHPILINRTTRCSLPPLSYCGEIFSVAKILPRIGY